MNLSKIHEYSGIWRTVKSLSNDRTTFNFHRPKGELSRFFIMLSVISGNFAQKPLIYIPMP